MRWKKTGEEGLLTVEAILGLVPFILVILGILGLFLDRPGLRGAQFYLSLLAFLLSTCIPVFSLSGSLQCTWVSIVYSVLLLLHSLAAVFLRK